MEIGISNLGVKPNFNRQDVNETRWEKLKLRPPWKTWWAHELFWRITWECQQTSVVHYRPLRIELQDLSLSYRKSWLNWTCDGALSRAIYHIESIPRFILSPFKRRSVPLHSTVNHWESFFREMRCVLQRVCFNWFESKWRKIIRGPNPIGIWDGDEIFKGIRCVEHKWTCSDSWSFIWLPW